MCSEVQQNKSQIVIRTIEIEISLRSLFPVFKTLESTYVLFNSYSSQIHIKPKIDHSEAI